MTDVVKITEAGLKTMEAEESFRITVRVHKTHHRAEAANPRQRISSTPVRLRPAGFGVTAFTRFARSSWHGLAEPKLAKRRAKAGGPGRTRTCNQTVMSGGLSVGFVDFAAFSFEFDLVGGVSFTLFLVRNWCG
ncbi:hypothetical protein [Bradyrhizobium nanningense]|uniref:hypothetical protein n=1 Tax=Bradyrhizobium nanningense TaxID=1325118 RepID=UPI001009133E|nr:hypothetical protein [Bradyrhizobium nanningense]